MRRALPLFFLLAFAISASGQKDCPQDEYRDHIVATNPSVAKNISDIEAFISRQRLRNNSANRTDGVITPDIITIPVVIHILYNKSEQNISDAQVQSQLDVLNKDFMGLNDDRTKLPPYFSSFFTDAHIRFALAKVDPIGKTTSGIVRKQTTIQSFNIDDRVKSSSLGGDDSWTADKYLNIWVCNLVSGILGYSSIPGGPAEKDGVVINTSVFGTFNVNPSFNKGRTATHEIGHWLNLRHIWGDASCGDDKVDDTPGQERANRGCPGGEKFSCSSSSHGDMYMNFMDLTDDACMFMFTHGQKERMRALFAPGGPRYSMLSSADVLAGSEVPEHAIFPGDLTKEINIFPVPATDLLQVRVPAQDCAGKTMNIYNQLGQVVFSQRMTRSNEAVNISTLRSGSYYLKIEGSKTLMAKFVKL